MTEPSNQAPQKILGYTTPTEANRGLVNSFKSMEEAILRALDASRGTDLDQRWVAIARTHFEQGFMALNRSVFQPQRVDTPLAPNDAFAGAMLLLEERSSKMGTEV